MIRPFAVALLVIAGPAWAQEAPAPQRDRLETGNPAQILFVGNSYLYYGDSLHNHVRRMAQAAYPEGEFAFKSATISGAYLDQHEISSYLEPGRLGLDAPFDVVVLQGHSRAATTPDRLNRLAAAVRHDAEDIRAHGAEVALYMTPAYTEANEHHDPSMFDRIDRGYTTLANEVGAVVLPVGLAFEMAYEARPDIVLHKPSDGSHPSLLGTYLAAATVYAALYDASPVGNPYDYDGAIGVEDAAFLQQVAERAVEAYTAR